MGSGVDLSSANCFDFGLNFGLVATFGLDSTLGLGPGSALGSELGSGLGCGSDVGSGVGSGSAVGSGLGSGSGAGSGEAVGSVWDTTEWLWELRVVVVSESVKISHHAASYIHHSLFQRYLMIYLVTRIFLQIAIIYSDKRYK